MMAKTVTAEEHAAELQSLLAQSNSSLEIAQHRISELGSYEGEVRHLRDQVAGLLAENAQIGAQLQAAQKEAATASAAARDANASAQAANEKVAAAKQIAAALKVLAAQMGRGEVNVTHAELGDHYGFAPISASGSGDTTVLAGVNDGTARKIRVVSYAYDSSGTVNVKFRSSGGTDLTGLFYWVANTGISVHFSPLGHFETVAGEGLIINLSGAVPVGGHLTYTLIQVGWTPEYVAGVVARATAITDFCAHGRKVGEILDVPMEPIDMYLRQCVCCLNIFPTPDASIAFCPECRGAAKVILP